MKNSLALQTLGVGLLFLTACGSDSEDFFGDTQVETLSVNDSTIQLGEGTVLAVEFSFDENRVLSGGKNVRLVVKLPAELRYRDETAEIEEDFSDRKIGAQVTRCAATGESYLLFDMDDNDLENASTPGNGADAKLKLTIDGISRAQFTVVAAQAREATPLFACGENFISDEQIAVSVL